MLPISRPQILIAVAFLALAAHGAFQTQRANRYRAEAAAATQRASAIQAGLSSANATIDQLNAGNKKLIEIGDLQKQMLVEANKRLEFQARELEKWRRALTVQENRDRGIPACQKLLASDLAVCPGHLDSLRARAGRLP